MKTHLVTCERVLTGPLRVITGPLRVLTGTQTKIKRSDRGERRLWGGKKVHLKYI